MSNNVVKLESQLPASAYAGEPMSAGALMMSNESLDRMLRVADLMASGRATVPQHLQKNPSDCFAVVMQAMQWGMNPFVVAQKTHLVNGTLGYEAQLINAAIVSQRATIDRPNYEWFGDWSKVDGKSNKDEKVGVKIWATVRGEAEPRVLTVNMSQVGVRNSPNWQSDPRQQIAYLAVKRWARLHTPDVILGVYTPDELSERPAPRDMGRAEEVGQPSGSSRTDAVRSKLASKRGSPSPTANLDKILRDIESAANAHELKKAIEPAANLASEADKETVRNAYQTKLNAERERAAREAAAQQPADAGEAPEITFDDLIARFDATSDVDVLDADASLIGQLPANRQQEAIEAYNKRREDLLGA